ncbi:MAG: ABC transporter permease [Candidatus Heimdallarchaeota archaeon]|nr:ABC transporter permease [Candidatus Heimdallarchaeota archaeon]MCG3257046.1 ABC transporter permease [Candidatus Heimdallarchaeota archaeon]MCK4612106.1 ABC transporter permease [Candidatus Heimdallarchaeota archaeon]
METHEGVFKSRFENIPFGVKRSFQQVNSTITFEFRRNVKNIFISIGIAIGVFLLSFIVNLISESRGVESPTTASGYAASYLSLVGFFILIIAVLYGGTIIALDYDKQTGNLLFPKITKGRLFIGRIIARYLLSAFAVTVFYIVTAITTVIKYKILPVEIWASWGWALFYTFLVLSMVTFFSSFLKKSSTTIVISLLMVLLVFNMGTMILRVTGIEIEPLFFLTYYGNIISASLDMPVDRFGEVPLGPGPDSPTGFQWLTPSATGAAAGMLIYSTVFLVAAYFLFRRRQQK